MRFGAGFIGLVLGVVMASAAAAQEVAGDWDGALTIGGGMTLRLALHVVHEPDGLTATLDSLDQGALGIPASSTALDGGKVRIEVTKIGGASWVRSARMERRSRATGARAGGRRL